MQKKQIFLLGVLLATPLVAFAQPGQYPGDLIGVANYIISVFLSLLWIIAAAFVVIMFVIAGFKFLTAQGEQSKVAEARQAVIWGLVGVVVIVLAWSVVAFISRQFGV